MIENISVDDAIEAFNKGKSISINASYNSYIAIDYLISSTNKFYYITSSGKLICNDEVSYLRILEPQNKI